MEITTLHIKNMVCDRCVRTVHSTLEGIGWKVIHVELGNARIVGLPDKEGLYEIQHVLNNEGFDLVTDKETQLVEEIKTRIVERVHYSEESLAGMNLSGWLSDLLHHDYKYLSSFFSRHQGITIEKYYIMQRIEYVKELLSYGELTLSEIAWKTGFSSVHHLSAQFKQITGMTPTAFKKNISRKPLDSI
jgi:AraC family transcriptional regulator